MKNLVVILLLLFQYGYIYSIDFTKVGQAELEQNANSPNPDYYNYYRLTKSGKNEKGAIWINTPVNLNLPFIIEFKANFGDDPIGADTNFCYS